MVGSGLKRRGFMVRSELEFEMKSVGIRAQNPPCSSLLRRHSFGSLRNVWGGKIA